MEEFAFLVMILSLHSAAVCYERFYVPQAAFCVRPQTLRKQRLSQVGFGALAGMEFLAHYFSYSAAAFLFL